MSLTTFTKAKSFDSSRNNLSSASNVDELKLTPEQLKRIEENRLKALELQKKSNLTAISNSSVPTNNKNTKLTTITQEATKETKHASSTNLFASTSTVADGATKASSTLNGKCVYFVDETEGEQRFEIQIGYNKNLIDLFKTINSRRF
jgi:hypothetical protein